MFLVGLTGGIASGKSTISSMLEKLGAEIIDADQIAIEVIEPGTAGFEQVVATFGKAIIQADGSISRLALGELVFGNQAQMHSLQNILRPLRKQRIMQRLAESRSYIVVYVEPLLVEINANYSFDMIITVESGLETQIQRLIDSRHMTRSQAMSRVLSQATEAHRVAKADVCLDGSLPLSELETEVSKLWASINLQASKMEMV
jgi:dephospho-CoA kinase